MSKYGYQELVVKNIIGLVMITQVFVLIFAFVKTPYFLQDLAKSLQNLAKNSAMKTQSRAIGAITSLQYLSMCL